VSDCSRQIGGIENNWGTDIGEEDRDYRLGGDVRVATDFRGTSLGGGKRLSTADNRIEYGTGGHTKASHLRKPILHEFFCANHQFIRVTVAAHPNSSSSKAAYACL
jgi:hypothetical protein